MADKKIVRKKPARKIKDSLARVFDCIDKKQSFVLEAGAGSGKTRSLIESLKYILDKHREPLEKKNQRVVCITYTNVAKNEISERIDQNPLVFVGTIHEFLWLVIQNFQGEIRKEILEFNEADQKKHIDDLETKMGNVAIEYSQFGRKFENGRITHDDVIDFSSKIFKKYTKISEIVSDKYPFIFVDEYQDTQESTVDLLLQNLLPVSKKRLTVGFFGDSMQKIYDDVIGKIPQGYIDSGLLEFITKDDNFRCSKRVIEVLSKIRVDLVQKPAGKNLDGQITFIQCNSDQDDARNYKKTLTFLEASKGWDFDVQKTKILILTHKGIAGKIGYENLLEAYLTLSFGRDRLTKKEEAFSDFFLNKVEGLVSSYLAKKYSVFIKQLGIEGFEIRKHSDKERIFKLMSELIDIRNTGTTKDVLDFVTKNNLVTKTSKIEVFKQKLRDEPTENEGKQKFFDKLMAVKYQEVILVNEFIEGHTPYSTKHGVKGAEFDNVLVIIDDGSWNNYKFNDVFSGNQSNPKRYEQTRNLMYVCCSRAKDKLAVLALSKLDESAMTTVKAWFGEKNVMDVSTLP